MSTRTTMESDRAYDAVAETIARSVGGSSGAPRAGETSVPSISSVPSDPEGLDDRTRVMNLVVAALWSELATKGVSWLGFYVDRGDAPETERLILASCAPKPACSPIGMHGVCGQSLAGRCVRIVRDVAELGADYIACDPRDRSEIVVPLFDDAGRCWGVLDVDSHDVGAFDERDAAGLLAVLRAAGLTAE